MITHIIPPETEHYKFFAHTACEYFPCHETDKPEDFNCIFCYCPLYFYPGGCGGNHTTRKGVKDCTNCRIPHGKNGWEHINKKLREFFEAVSKKA